MSREVPAGVKAIHGFPGKGRKWQKRPLPASPQAMEPPEGLNTDAVAEWQRVMPLVRRLGLSTDADRATLTAYCCAWGVWQAAERVLAASALTITLKTGTLRQHPLIEVARVARRDCAKYAAALFGTAASRSSGLPLVPDEGDDPSPYFS